MSSERARSCCTLAFSAKVAPPRLNFSPSAVRQAGAWPTTTPSPKSTAGGAKELSSGRAFGPASTYATPAALSVA